MTEMNFLFGHNLGLARFATVLVSNAAQLSSSVVLKYHGQAIHVTNHPDSIMEIVNLDIKPYDQYQILVEGSDEADAQFVYKLRLREFEL
ncbi:HPr family phosphocarrier protein [Terribacillus saccharophilus]|uniref:HPr domain-containing protein n=1 Tax=Terribacillus saccharophilus TaxID=361277 RepID=A0ABX4H2V6_9BACI|nr:HPr family phosphocarrier protein [Terribacillus saccharophilus]PAD37156.1 hypothetical protein CHH56_00785 [Terribacillus saccharophilus]PAD97400.1 hypothetical protein CHH50_01490 [Terribacillus saccharophilus]PAE01448.1 hypothetical protein CHH48_01480 [Terribacillus saccharophilus]